MSGAAFLAILCVVCLLYVVLFGIVQVFRLAFAGANLMHHLRANRFSDHRRYLDSENMAPLSILVPLGSTPDAAVALRRFLSMDYPEYEVIAVYDHRYTESLAALAGELQLTAVPRPIRRQLPAGDTLAVYRTPLYPNLTVLHKSPGKAPDAINAAINLSRFPHFVVLHPFMQPEPDALLRLVMPFLADPYTVASTTNIRADFGEKSGSLLSILRAGDILRGTLSTSAGTGSPGMPKAGPGAVGAFRKQAVIDAGGFSPCGGGETNEMVLQLHKHLTDSGEEHHVRFVPDQLFRMRLPASARFWRKLCVWRQRAFIHCLKRHRSMLFRRRYGFTGLLDLPACWLFEVAGLFVTLAGYILFPVSCALGFVSPALLIGFFALSVLSGVVSSLGALLLEVNAMRTEAAPSQLALQCLMAVASNFGYRQFVSLYKIAGSFPRRCPPSGWDIRSR